MVERELERAKNGDPEAFSGIVRSHQHRVYNLALRMLRDPDEAKDATQDIFIKLHSRLKNFRHSSRLSTWVYRVATNHLLDQLRRAKRERTRRINRPWKEVTHLRNDPRSEDPAVVVNQEEVRQIVGEAVDELPDLYRTVIVLHYQQGLSYREIAEILGVSPRTVGTRIHRAKARLRSRLDPVWRGGGIDGGK
ncbi:RNA polymerase sigma-70 factor (ECF subfamily) [Melghirimyces profundicolus]|uniref:RNA polymerase sigma-70 factor (ECF subfamily) n=1 Tax=Melghirimyces profundicolus TaxID=1242148 RepID=A0A2T6BG38_9BACL|nr:RNA polymerase sigma-70 factor (ECF subfamily) [Melghirimyces profundicolus]